MNYSGKYPKAWGDFCGHNNMDLLYDLLDLFGYLVLEYFPKHGIEIARFIVDKSDCDYEVYHWATPDFFRYVDTFKIPEEAIDKAFEILEEQLAREK